MKLMIKQRVFAWSDTFDIYDETEQKKYFCKGEIFSLGHKLHVYDKNDNEIGYVKQELLHFLPVFQIYLHGQYVGKVSKKFSFFHPVYELEYKNWRVEGNFLGWDYDVFEGNNVILHISKELFHWGDTYVLDIARPEDELMGLMTVVAIDAAICSQEDHN